MSQNLEFREIVPFFLDCVKQLGCDDPNIQKQEFDIACRCPICGDSRTRKRLKRLHLYKKGDVINVNCFNGDCSVKNMTPYKFFQDYNIRIFEQFKNYYKRRFFNEIQTKSNKVELESIKADESIFDSEFYDPVSELNKSKIHKLIEDFQWLDQDDQDLENFKKLVKEIKLLGDQSFNYFKSIIN